MSTSKIHSYSPNGHVPFNPDYFLCGSKYHATSAAKLLSVSLFLGCLLVAGVNFFHWGFHKFHFSLFCLGLTVYSCVTMCGVYLERSLYLLPYLIVQGLVTLSSLALLVTFSLLGSLTDFIAQQHRDSAPLRELYRMNEMDADDEYAQTTVAVSVLVLMMIMFAFQATCWFIMKRAFQCYKENEIAYVPVELRDRETA